MCIAPRRPVVPWLALPYIHSRGSRVVLLWRWRRLKMLTGQENAVGNVDVSTKGGNSSYDALISRKVSTAVSLWSLWRTHNKWCFSFYEREYSRWKIFQPEVGEWQIHLRHYIQSKWLCICATWTEVRKFGKLKNIQYFKVLYCYE